MAALVHVGAAGAVRAKNPIVVENALPGTTVWNLPQSNFRQIEGYATEVSVAAGDTLHLHVQTTPAARYRVEIYRLGWYGGNGGRLIECLPGCATDEAGQPQPVPPFDRATGLDQPAWPVTDELVIPSDWVSGYYLADLVLTGKPGVRVGSRVPFIVKAAPGEHSRVLVQVPVNTWEAYNAWGGRSLYFPDQSGIGDNQVAFQRPYASTPFSAGSEMQWELPLLRFLEREGYDLSYQTDVDTDADPGSLLAHRLVIDAGHDEYWTTTIRTALETARDAGTNLIFMGADQGYWQMRYADASRSVIVEYRHASLDPEPDPALKTTYFRKLVPPRPECTLLGTDFADVAGPWGAEASIGSVGDYAVSDDAADVTWFQGTGLEPGDMLHGLVGDEWNVVVPGCVPAPLTVLFRSVGVAAQAAAVTYTAPSGARVFDAGSLAFAYGLDDNRFYPAVAPLQSSGLETFMQNVVDDLSRPPAPVSLAVRMRASGLVFRIVQHGDARVRGVLILSHPGAGPFDLSSAGVHTVCFTRGSVCVVRGLHNRPSRYAAVAVDAWGRSLPTLSGAVGTR